MGRKKVFAVGILTISMGLILSILVGKGLGDDAGDPYSGRSSDTIQAWYDETWQASGYYQLGEVVSPTLDPDVEREFRYAYTTTPNTTSNPTFLEESTHVVLGDNISGASLPQDIVITEWRATGHVHFTSQ